MVFENAVRATNDVKDCHQPGLQALGKHSTKIRLRESSQCGGSLNIDDCTKKLYPEESRWDYAIAYRDKVHFVEVHTANTSEVRKMSNKLKWLKDWLVHKAPEINRLRATEKAFVWIQSDGFAIPAHAPQLRVLAQLGLKPVARLELY